MGKRRKKYIQEKSPAFLFTFTMTSVSMEATVPLDVSSLYIYTQPFKVVG